MSELLQTVEIEPDGPARASVIWLHGLGADGNDFAPIVPELGLPSEMAVRFVFPHAPMMPVSINDGYVMRAWYDVSFDGLDKRPDERGIRISQAAIERLLAREQARGIPARRTVLAGFSQGGAMTLHTGLRHAETLAGLVVLSSYLPLPSLLAAERSVANAATPIFMAHGDDDPLIPVDLAARSLGCLRNLGYRVDWHTYPMEHAVCRDEIDRIGEWLGRVLA